MNGTLYVSTTYQAQLLYIALFPLIETKLTQVEVNQ